ncbi:type IV toxin-antitoxin system AbiEi family antitoxin domain-containing protein [Actinospica sp. MGRD01-02]|uniref:Type IV toxin-antitoxin system AbiEi family antitoxin domain-containing protein n=1 Tax=Actinospica acidithermotolerans TaxID=2828514 RepID=A0A941E5C7_9ACTN|nr:type IV toxin-antitoxin system AbiEi family antitoxin domain-containing protein [Actinospica acidithermotolerans]MBR7824702.1 type IV toxin-antitoxin system AbiEi family antitoxin domain-containing protein [Actinospica acidithermotolerans]
MSGATDTPLPETFTYTDARTAGISKRRLYKLRDDGQIEQLGHGLFQRSNRGHDADIDLIEIAIRAPKATLCLTTALARHGLTDEIPAGIDIALPRGQWRPATRAPAIWHSFTPATFDLGRETLELTKELSIGLYSPERSIIDAFRLRHREGSDLAIGALKRWLRLPGSQPATLLGLAADFPRTRPALRTALETLLA